MADSQTAVLECEVANPSSEGKWLKNGESVDFNENTLSEVNGAIRRLVIVITKGTDIGEYTYQVANSKTTANLRVEGRSKFDTFDKGQISGASNTYFFIKCSSEMNHYTFLNLLVCVHLFFLHLSNTPESDPNQSHTYNKLFTYHQSCK